MLKAGDLAYFDGIKAVVPVKIRRVWQNEQTRAWQVEARVTASRWLWARGEVITASLHFFHPRTSVPLRQGKFLIRGREVPA